MAKKGQAAMEFLMTYGWAILVVLAAIGALAYFGVLSPGKLLPERTVFKAPLTNTDNALITLSGSTAAIEIPFINNKGNSINISNANWVTTTSDDCSATAATELVSGTNPIPNGGRFTLRFNCTTTKAVGEKLKADITFDYINLETGQTRPHSGAVDGEVFS